VSARHSERLPFQKAATVREMVRNRVRAKVQFGRRQKQTLVPLGMVDTKTNYNKMCLEFCGMRTSAYTNNTNNTVYRKCTETQSVQNCDAVFELGKISWGLNFSTVGARQKL